jgi:hypothetical protein
MHESPCTSGGEIYYPADRMRHDGDITNDTRRTNGDWTMRLTVPEAAGVMGISAEAVRQRIKRGTLTTEKDDSGHVFVLLVDDGTRFTTDSTRKDGDITALVDNLREQVVYLKETVAQRDEEIRRRDHLLAAALERIPAIEAGDEREGHMTASEEADKGTAPPEQQKPSERRSWWHRFFFEP